MVLFLGGTCKHKFWFIWCTNFCKSGAFNYFNKLKLTDDIKNRRNFSMNQSTKINVAALAFQINQSHNVGIVRSKQVDAQATILALF